MSLLNIHVLSLDKQPRNAIAFNATPGACIVNCIKDGMAHASWSGSPVTVLHNGREYLILPRDTYEQVCGRADGKAVKSDA